MERELLQLKSDSADAWDKASEAVTLTLLAIVDLLIIGGAVAGRLHQWLGETRKPRQNVTKILHDPERRAREAGL